MSADLSEDFKENARLLAVEGELQRKSPCYHADSFLERKWFGSKSFDILPGQISAGEFLDNIAHGQYLEESSLIYLPRANGGIENYAGQLLGVIRKIRDMAKTTNHVGRIAFTEPPEQIAPRLSGDEMHLLKIAPGYFEGLQTLAREQWRQMDSIATDPKKRARAVEEHAQMYADMVALARHIVSAGERVEKGEDVSTAFNDPAMDAPAKIGVTDYRRSNHFIKVSRPGFISEIATALPDMATDIATLNSSLATTRGEGVKAAPKRSGPQANAL